MNMNNNSGGNLFPDYNGPSHPMGDGFGYGFPKKEGSGNAPVGAPRERTDAPVPEAANRQPGRFAIYNPDPSGPARPNEWREPNFNQPYEAVSSMFSPGICMDGHYSQQRKRGQNREPAQKVKKERGGFGRFLKAACLVVVCAVLSGAATYGVLEYRIMSGDFDTGTNVTFGSTPSIPEALPQDGIAATTQPSGAGMSAEDIYTMACSQVVSIITNVESRSSDVFGGIFPDGFPDGTEIPDQDSGIYPDGRIIIPDGESEPDIESVISGSGFIVSDDGYILTNYHVVETAHTEGLPVMVSLNDGTEYEAEVIGYDSTSDVALIKIEAEGLYPVVIGDSDGIQVGQTVYAVGNPLGEFIYSMTEGIISGRDREVFVENKIISTFQFSAAVNSGNSGGPVYDAKGEVIGIVTAKPMINSVEGIGFAIPINDAMAIAEELIEFGYISGRPLLGIMGGTVSQSHSAYYGWGVVGVYVSEVNDDSAASIAGMERGDIIIKLGDTEIDTMETLQFALRQYKAGETAGITVWRDGESVELSITFDEDLSAGK